MDKRSVLITDDIQKVFECGIDDWFVMASACVGILNAYGLKKTPGWFDKEVVIDYPGIEEEDVLELGEWINMGTKNPTWRERMFEYVNYIIKING